MRLAARRNRSCGFVIAQIVDRHVKAARGGHFTHGCADATAASGDEDNRAAGRGL
jgi:hypothetical protein